MSCGFVVDSTEIYLCCSCLSAGWSLDNCGKGGWDLKLVKDAILLAFYEHFDAELTGSSIFGI